MGLLIFERQWIWIIIAVVVLVAVLGSVLNEILGSLFLLIGLAVAGYVIWRLAFNRAVQLPLHRFEVSGRQGVNVDNPFGAFSPGDFGRIDLDISVPETSDVRVRSDASSITIDGIQGHAYMPTNAGTITVQNVKLEGNVRMETNAGTISFSGSIDPNGDYSFETHAGTIDMALPAGTAFILDARTNLGTVSNQFGNTYMGEGPRARLHLHTHLGTIRVKPMW